MGNSFNSVSESSSESMGESRHDVLAHFESKFVYVAETEEAQVLYDKILKLIHSRRFKYKKKYDEALCNTIEILKDKKLFHDKYFKSFDAISQFHKFIVTSTTKNSESTEKNMVEQSVEKQLEVSLTQFIISTTYPIHLCLCEKFNSLTQPITDYFLPFRTVSADHISRTLELQLYPCLLIGPWMFMVNEYGLCIPQIHSSGVYKYDIMKRYGIPVGDLEASDIIEIAKIAIQYNTNQLPQSASTMDHRAVNVEFIKSCIQKVAPGFVESNKQIATLLQHLTTQNESLKLLCDMRILSSIEPSGSITFTSHEQLDNFIDKVIASDRNVSRNLPILWSLLCCFDSVFFIKHQITKNSIYCPRMVNNNITCHFNDLHQSMSNRFVDHLVVGNKKIEITNYSKFA